MAGFFGHLWGDITHPFGAFGGYHDPGPPPNQQPKPNQPVKMGSPTMQQPRITPSLTQMGPPKPQPVVKDFAGSFSTKTPLNSPIPGLDFKSSVTNTNPQPAPKSAPQQNQQPKSNTGFWGRVGAQLNPFDNGRTFQHPTPQPGKGGSVLHQATHNGVTNAIGNFAVKPFVINPAQNVIETGRMAAADVTNNPKAQAASQAREVKNLKSSLPGQVASMGYYIGKANTYDLIKQALSKNGNNDLYMQDINKTPIGQLLNPVQHVAAKYQVNRDIKNVSPQQKDQIIKQNLAKVGLDPNQSLTGQMMNSALSAVTLATGPKAMESLAAMKGVKTSSLDVQLTKEATTMNKADFVNKNFQEARAAGFTDITKADLGKIHDQANAGVKTTSPVSGRQVTLPAEPGTPPGPKLAAAEGTTITKPQVYEKGPAGVNALEGRVPVKAVQGGDYAAARVAPQLASNPIDVATGQAARAIKVLSPAEKSQLIDAVEHPADHPNMSPKLAEAVRRVNYLTDRVHATSNALATDEFGKTPYINNYYHHEVDLTNPQDAARFADLLKTSNTVMPENFHGINNMPRVFNDVRELHAAGFKLVHEGDPVKQILEYGARASSGVKRQALIKAATEADTPAQVASGAPRTLDLGGGKNIILSERGIKEFKGYTQPVEAGKLLKGYRALNKGFKQTLLSMSQFHPININALQAAPSLVLRGHPILAAQGLGDTVATLVNRGYSDKLIQGALEDGTIDKAAMMGTPIKFGSDFRAGGKLDQLKEGKISGFGEKAIFERQLPAMHIKMVQALSKDLERRNIPLDSPQALEAGTTVNKIMGYVNTAVQNHDPRVQKALGDILLAPQFTRAKWEVLGDALSKGPGSTAGNYARSAVIGKYLTEAGIVQAGGAATGQKQNSLTDNLKQTLVGPSIPTPWTDSKGNTIRFKLPQNYVSEAAGLGTTVKRGDNGRLSLDFNPKNIPGNVANYGRARLAVIPSNALKVATNQNYAGRPMYDPTAPMGTKAEQAATTVVSNTLPIGLQGVMETNAVMNRLPAGSREVLQAEKPGSNPVIKSVMSALGATPSTDVTTGKGLQTKQYYDALNKAAGTLPPNSPQMGAFLESFGATKNPVTGKYYMAPNSEMTVAKSSSLNAYPQAAAAANQMAQDLQKAGQKVDPYYLLTPDQQKAYNAYETMAPLSADRTDWQNKNSSWFPQFQQSQSNFFAGLPKGDPNKPANPIKYPQATGQTLTDTNLYYSIPKDQSQEKTNWLNSHPDVVAQLNAQFQYDNAVRVARGYAPVKDSPQPSDKLQSFMTQYNAADKATRANIRNSQPQMYQNMIAFYDSAGLASIGKSAALAQLQGEPDYTSQELKDIGNLSQDIYKNTNGSYSIIPAGWMLGLKSAFGGSGGSSSYGSGGFKTSNGAYMQKAPTTFSKADATLAKLSRETSNIPKARLPRALRAGRGGGYTPRVGTARMATTFKKPSRAGSMGNVKARSMTARASKTSNAMEKTAQRPVYARIPSALIEQGKSQRVKLSI